MDATTDIGKMMSQLMQSKYIELPPRRIRPEQYPDLLRSREYSALTPSEKYTQSFIWCLSLRIDEYEKSVLQEHQISAVIETVLDVLKSLRYLLVYGKNTLGTPPYYSPIEPKLSSKQSHPEDDRNMKTLDLLIQGKQKIASINYTKRLILNSFYKQLNTVEDLRKTTKKNMSVNSENDSNHVNSKKLDSLETDQPNRTKVHKVLKSDKVEANHVESKTDETMEILKYLVLKVRDAELEMDMSFNQACLRIEKYKRKLI